MIDRDLWQEVLQSLRRNRLRTILTASGIFWGIFILIIMLGFGNGIEGGVKRSMAGYATNTIYIWGSETSVPYQGLSPGRRIVLNNDDTAEILNTVPEIDHLAPRIRLGRWRGRNDVSHGTKITDAEISGDMPGFEKILPMTVAPGRFINPLDIQQKRKVAVIAERISSDLFGAGVDPVGKQIRIRDVSFTVIGLFKPRRYGSDRDRMISLVFIPLSTFQQVYGDGRRIGFYAMVPQVGLSSESVGEKIKTVLRQRHRIAPNDSRAVGSWHPEIVRRHTVCGNENDTDGNIHTGANGRSAGPLRRVTWVVVS